jgi:hypothetical protein
MEEKLLKALDSAKLRYTLSLERRRLQEKLRSDLTYSINGGKFYIDRNFIVFLNLLTPEEGRLSTTILDDNLNPIYIEDITKFQQEALTIYLDSINRYAEAIEVIRKKRNVWNLMEL